MFPRVPGQSGYNKRVHSLTATMTWVCAALRRGSRVHDDTAWLVDSTPIECTRSRPTMMRSALAGRAQYGYCASRSRFFWGLRLHHPQSSSGLGPDSRYLAQQPHQRACPTILNPLRPPPHPLDLLI